ncbi:MAG: polyphenol oxidase family protein [Helicobacter sp.]|nr:polyphenol oxidase family protein [Helicobacter sp.]
MESVLAILQKHLVWTLSNRYGGQSQAPYDSLNLAFHVGDEEQNVAQNRQILLQSLGLCDRTLVAMDQIHSNKIVVLDSNAIILPNSQPQGDCLLSHRDDVALLVMVADCNPILLYDPVRDVFGVIHAGRKGIELGILIAALQKMHTHFGCLMCDIVGFVGASIRSCCYEVGVDVAQNFAQQTTQQSLVWRGECVFLDLLVVLKMQWQQSGCLAQNLAIDKRCSACCAEFFSYRRQGICGRFGIIAAKKQRRCCD